jgi:hypothetical protein
MSGMFFLRRFLVILADASFSQVLPFLQNRGFFFLA